MEREKEGEREVEKEREGERELWSKRGKAIGRNIARER